MLYDIKIVFLPSYLFVKQQLAHWRKKWRVVFSKKTWNECFHYCQGTSLHYDLSTVPSVSV